MGGVDKVKRQHDQGRLTVRERIDGLIDKNSFHEIGAISGIAEYDENSELKHLTPANCVFGRGKIDGRTVVVVGDDFTVRGGSADASISAKPLMAEEMAHDFRLPIIRVIEGSGGGGSVKTIETRGRCQSARRGRRHTLVLVHDREHGARARGGPRARFGRGPWRGAACCQPLFGHDPEFGDVRRRSAGREAPRPGSDKAGTWRRRDPDPRRWRRRCRRYRGGGVRTRPAFSVLSAVIGVRPAADHALYRRSGTRGRIAVEGGAAQSPPGLQDAPDHRRRRRQGLVLRGQCQFRPPCHHRACPARRPRGAAAGQRSLPLWRVVDGGSLPEGGALGRFRRDVPSAGGLSDGLSGLHDRARGREVGDHSPRRARDGGGQPVDRALVHHHRTQRVRRGWRRAPAGQPLFDALCLAVGLLGLAAAGRRHRGGLPRRHRRFR